jgi:hypothetical protein
MLWSEVLTIFLTFQQNNLDNFSRGNVVMISTAVTTQQSRGQCYELKKKLFFAKKWGGKMTLLLQNCIITLFLKKKTLHIIY